MAKQPEDMIFGPYEVHAIGIDGVVMVGPASGSSIISHDFSISVSSKTAENLGLIYSHKIRLVVERLEVSNCAVCFEHQHATCWIEHKGFVRTWEKVVVK